MKVLVTGASGNVGFHVVKALLAKGEAVKAAGSDPGKLDALFNGNVETCTFDFEDPGTYEQALAGVDRVYLMRPPHLGNARALYPFIDFMRTKKLRLVSFLSLMGVEKNPFPPHHRIEKHLKKTGIPYSFIRPSFFMQNLTGVHLKEIKEDSELFIPAGKSRTSFIDAKDIGLAVACVLQDPSRYADTTHTLTGPKALTYKEVARIMSSALGRPIHYRKPGFLSYRRHMLKNRGMKKGFVRVTMMLYLMTRLGAARHVNDEFQRITGRPPTSLKAFVKDHTSLFEPS